MPLQNDPDHEINCFVPDTSASKVMRLMLQAMQRFLEAYGHIVMQLLMCRLEEPENACIDVCCLGRLIKDVQVHRSPRQSRKLRRYLGLQATFLVSAIMHETLLWCAALPPMFSACRDHLHQAHCHGRLSHKGLCVSMLEGKKHASAAPVSTCKHADGFTHDMASQGAYMVSVCPL